MTSAIMKIDAQTENAAPAQALNTQRRFHLVRDPPSKPGRFVVATSCTQKIINILTIIITIFDFLACEGRLGEFLLEVLFELAVEVDGLEPRNHRRHQENFSNPLACYHI